MGTGSFPGVKRPKRGVDHPPHLAPRFKKEQSYTSTPPMGLCGLFQRELYLYLYLYPHYKDQPMNAVCGNNRHFLWETPKYTQCIERRTVAGTHNSGTFNPTYLPDFFSTWIAYLQTRSLTFANKTRHWDKCLRHKWRQPVFCCYS